jgi:hypothetical protein
VKQTCFWCARMVKVFKLDFSASSILWRVCLVTLTILGNAIATVDPHRQCALEDLVLATVSPPRHDWLEVDVTTTSTTTAEARGFLASCLDGVCHAARLCVNGVCNESKFLASSAVNAISTLFDLPIEQQIELTTKGLIVINGVKLVVTCSNPTFGALLLTASELTASDQRLIVDGYHKIEKFLRGSSLRSVSTEIVLKPRIL